MGREGQINGTQRLITIPPPPISGIPPQALAQAFMNGILPPSDPAARAAYFDILYAEIRRDDREHRQAKSGVVTTFSWCFLLASGPTLWDSDLCAARDRANKRAMRTA